MHFVLLFLYKLHAIFRMLIFYFFQVAERMLETRRTCKKIRFANNCSANDEEREKKDAVQR